MVGCSLFSRCDLTFLAHKDLTSNLNGKILQQRDANRETIFRAFEDIPNLVVKAQEAHQLFPTESKIQNEVVKFYETLLEEIPKLIDLLLHRNRQTSKIFMP